MKKGYQNNFLAYHRPVEVNLTNEHSDISESCTNLTKVYIGIINDNDSSNKDKNQSEKKNNKKLEK